MKRPNSPLTDKWRNIVDMTKHKQNELTNTLAFVSGLALVMFLGSETSGIVMFFVSKTIGLLIGLPMILLLSAWEAGE